MKGLSRYVQSLPTWIPTSLPADIPHGDMPGDKIEIGSGHIAKAELIMTPLLEAIAEAGGDKVVVSVYGGSGVGKSEIASLLNFHLHALGIGSYIMSGDNYPHRIPQLNDAERERVYETSGEQGLRSYLGSEYEINFKEVNEIIRLFHEGASEIFLRRMGRQVGELWYEPVDFEDVIVLLLEWTHGNSAHLRDVDIPIFLNSTPEETLAHRRARNRDGKVDSPFTTLVLTIEQELLASRRDTAKIVVSKAGELE